MIEIAESVVLQELPDIYIIPFPKYVFSNMTHHLGSYPLHYDELYYEYASKAIMLIAKEKNDMDYYQRKKIIDKELFFLKHEFENKFLRIMSLSGIK